MSWRIKIDDWYFIIESVKAIKIKDDMPYSSPIDAIGHITIDATGKALIGSLLARDCEQLSRDDFRTLKKYLRKLGIEEYESFRAVDGELRLVKREVSKIS